MTALIEVLSEKSTHEIFSKLLIRLLKLHVNIVLMGTEWGRGRGPQD
jgi:hypothetical protein